MLREELLRKVRRIEVTTRKIVDDVMSGQYRSHFKGHGIQFSEHRIYSPGDDVRHIDWKVSARTREPLIKKFEEERELTVLLIVDVSASEVFGSTHHLKSEVVAELGGMLTYAASQTGDKVGAILFAGEVETIIPPKKGRHHVQRVIRDLLGYEPKTKGTDLAGALEAAGRILKHSGVVFILSDFLTDSPYEVPLQKLARKHDVVAVWIRDQREMEIPAMGLLRLVNPETGKETWVNPASYGFKRWIKEFWKEHEEKTSGLFRKRKVETLKVYTQENHADVLVRFFNTRRLRR